MVLEFNAVYCLTMLFIACGLYLLTSCDFLDAIFFGAGISSTSWKTRN